MQEVVYKKAKQGSTKIKADEIKAKWSNGTFTEEEQLMYATQVATEISPLDPKIPGLGNSPELFSALSTVNEEGFLTEAYPTLGGLVLVKVTKITKPTAEQLEQRSKMESTRLRRQREAAAWQAFEMASRDDATVEETWKQWQQ